MSQRAYLISVTDGPHRGLSATISEGQTFTVGRAPDSAIRVPSARVSRHHASLSCDDVGRLWVKDLTSANGTFVDGRSAHECVELYEGAMIYVGDVILEVASLDGEPMPSGVGDEASNPSSAEHLFGGPLDELGDDHRYLSERPLMMGVVMPPDVGLSFDDVLEQCASSTGYFHARADAYGQEAQIYVQGGRLRHISLGAEPDPFIVFANLLVVNARWEIVQWRGEQPPRQTLDVPLSTFIEQFHQRYMGYR